MNLIREIINFMVLYTSVLGEACIFLGVYMYYDALTRVTDTW